MKKLYLDHHIIARETGGQPANWEQLTAILGAGHLRDLPFSELVS
jgi:hypothetical protein